MLFSVVVPVYNVEKYLRECVESILRQTFDDFELILVDDGSKDSSGAICDEYAATDNRIKVIDKENEGQAIARNLGIKIAKGEYLGFVDSDDWVDEEYFENLYESAQRNNCDIACAGFKRCKPNKTKIKKSFNEEKVLTFIKSKVIADNLPADNYIWNKNEFIK